VSTYEWGKELLYRTVLYLSRKDTRDERFHWQKELRERREKRASQKLQKISRNLNGAPTIPDVLTVRVNTGMHCITG
jgi:hypothetical protein